jgi:hypothetical protein
MKTSPHAVAARQNTRLFVTFVLGMGFTLHAAGAYAQEPAPPPPPAPPGPAAPAVAATSTAEQEEDGVRFRGGVSLGAGPMFIAYSGFLAGVDGRLGLQINDLIGVYVQPHLSFGTAKVGAVKGFTGVVAATGLAEVTLMDHFFVAAGGGYGVLNNPNGPVVHFRLGGYPLMGSGEGARRKGLMLGIDTRLFFVPGDTGMQLMGALGYEAF